MSFLDKFKAFVSYVREFPDPGWIEKHTNLRTSYLDLKNRVNRLEKENELLRKRSHIKGSFSRHNGAYFLETPDGQEEPFCSECWDAESKLVRLHLGHDAVAECPRCRNSFGDCQGRPSMRVESDFHKTSGQAIPDALD